MTKKRIHEILNQEKINEVFYNDRPVWIQETDGVSAKIGFLNENTEKDVYIKDLYE